MSTGETITNQQEIREGVADMLKGAVRIHKDKKGETQVTFSTYLHLEILAYLHSKGCVIKVDKPFPDVLCIDDEGKLYYALLPSWCTGPIKEAGYAVVGSLIDD